MYSDQNPILQLYKKPLHKTLMVFPDIEQTEINRSCGDTVTLYFRFSKDSSIIEDISFVGEGCSLSLSSAELVCRLIIGQPLSQAKKLANLFLTFLKSNPSEPLSDLLPKEFLYYDELRSYPMRQKCAAMAWEIIQSLEH